MAEQAKYVCTKACFYRNRVWGVGEILLPRSGEQVPHHFKEDAAAVEQPKIKGDTFSGMQEAEKAETQKAEKEKKEALEKKRGRPLKKAS